MNALIVGNWKMNGTAAAAAVLAGSLASRLTKQELRRFDMLVCPPAPLLASARSAIGTAPLALGAQDCHAQPQGAHTGDISVSMLVDAGCSHVIVGHSERRAAYGEGDSLVRAKAAAAQAGGLVPVICVGETLDQRDAGATVGTVTGQLASSLPDGSSAATAIIAYEPVWAIGTGRTPAMDDIAEVHAAIRAALRDRVPDPHIVRILYGGSVNPRNARDILSLDNVDGALVGGASLEADQFWAIAEGCP